jgi:hypothetical protein
MAHQDDRPLRSALFVDFDNIFITLERNNPALARRFAQEPLQWLRWLERDTTGLPAGTGAARPARRVLVRRCYLNPQSFHEFRPYFIRSGFEVIDCPPLTAQGKTSADVMMALDIIDALSHPANYDEYQLFSGDADFTPVLVRLRKHDRRTTVLAAGPSAAAYKAACDRLIEEDEFLEHGLGVTEAERRPAPTPRPSKAQTGLLAKIGTRLYEVANLTGGVPAMALPAIYKEFSEFTQSENWLGYFSLRGLTEAICTTQGQLQMQEGDPWMVMPKNGFAEGAGAPGDTQRDVEIAAFVREQVARSPAPMQLAPLASRLIDRFGESVRGDRWQGAGSFSAFLGRLDLEALVLSSVIPGYVYDPARHEAPVAKDAGPDEDDAFARDLPEVAELARRIHDLTETPYLSPGQYATVLREIAKEINQNGFDISQTSKVARDGCYAKGVAVSRANVNFLLKGLLYSGYRWKESGQEDPYTLGEAVVRNTITLARRTQFDLTGAQEQLVRHWMLGGFDEPDAATDAA